MSEQYQITRKQLVQLLKAAEIIDGKCYALDEILGDAFSELLGREVWDIYDIIFDVIGVPPEDTTDDPDGYCRDWLYDKVSRHSETLNPQIDIDKMEDGEFESMLSELEAMHNGWVDEQEQSGGEL